MFITPKATSLGTAVYGASLGPQEGEKNSTYYFGCSKKDPDDKNPVRTIYCMTHNITTIISQGDYVHDLEHAIKQKKMQVLDGAGDGATVTVGPYSVTAGKGFIEVKRFSTMYIYKNIY